MERDSEERKEVASKGSRLEVRAKGSGEKKMRERREWGEEDEREIVVRATDTWFVLNFQ